MSWQLAAAIVLRDERKADVSKFFQHQVGIEKALKVLQSLAQVAESTIPASPDDIVNWKATKIQVAVGKSNCVPPIPSHDLLQLQRQQATATSSASGRHGHCGIRRS